MRFLRSLWCCKNQYQKRDVVGLCCSICPKLMGTKRTKKGHVWSLDELTVNQIFVGARWKGPPGRCASTTVRKTGDDRRQTTRTRFRYYDSVGMYEHRILSPKEILSQGKACRARCQCVHHSRRKGRETGGISK